MSIDGYQIIVEFECGRTLPGWIPRRLGYTYTHTLSLSLSLSLLPQVVV